MRLSTACRMGRPAPVKRRGFQAVKRLVLFLTYAKALKEGRNPNWPALGYVAPGAAGPGPPPNPSVTS